MTIDVTKFYLANVFDTCSIWNVISSSTLYVAAIDLIRQIAITEYVYYEALIKPRSTQVAVEKEKCR